MFLKVSNIPGGTHIGKWYGDVPLVMTPFFSGQSVLPSLPIYHQCAAHVPSPFSIFRKILHFQPCFGRNFSSQDANFPKYFFPKTPHFSRKICSLDPTFVNPCGTHPQKKVECSPPPPRVISKPRINLWLKMW